jgi:3-deoxy-7-phosphoheptulonate synthase
MNELIINGENFSQKGFGIIAGPCAIESKQQLIKTAKVLKENNVGIMRAGAFKPRTSPKDFQGLGEEGIFLLEEIGKKFGLATETEIMDTKQINFLSEKIDVLRVGARNMQNYSLLKELSKIENPVILKNGLASTYNEFISAADYLKENGKKNIILCWRGIRTFEQETRFSIDMLAPHIIKQKTNLPLIIDPSHSTGKKEFVEIMSKTAIIAGANGLIVEIHPEPEKALCDKQQQLSLKEFPEYLKKIRQLIEIKQKLN